MSEPRRDPPRSIQVLHRWVSDHAKAEGVAPARLQRWISFMVLAAALDRVRDEADEPLFVVKGGVGMELRLQLRARATKDFDTFFRQSIDTMVERLDDALREPRGDFQFQRGEPQPIGQTTTVRFEIQVIYKGRVWQRTILEVAPAEGRLADATMVDRVSPMEIAQFGLDGPSYVSCIPIRYQIAQKIHACTERFEVGPENQRFRDLIDILLLRGLLQAREVGVVREACVDVFDARAKHAWPPDLAVPAAWAAPYAALAAELEFPVTEVEDAANLVRDFIREIHEAR